MLDLSAIQIGRRYDRPWLAATWGFAGHEAISKGVFCPKDGGQIILFVTRIKQKTFEQFNDYISGEYLFWEGESKHGNDSRIVRAQKSGEVIHLFYREIHHSPFEYKGPVELIDHQLLTDRPSKFVFRLFHDQSAQDDLETHGTEISVLPETERESVTKARIGQGIFRAPSEEFRGVYIEGALHATRANVLAPGAIGVYTGGSTYNPAQVMRDASSESATRKLDKLLQSVADKAYVKLPLKDLRKLVELTVPDQTASEKVWDPTAVAESISQFAAIREQNEGYVYVDRDRGLKEARSETQGILTGGEAAQVPDDRLTLFLLRTKAGRGTSEAWWPQIRLPKGTYGFAFAV